MQPFMPSHRCACPNVTQILHVRQCDGKAGGARTHDAVALLRWRENNSNFEQTARHAGIGASGTRAVADADADLGETVQRAVLGITVLAVAYDGGAALLALLLCAA